jgi:DNA topoisomerase IA
MVVLDHQKALDILTWLADSKLGADVTFRVTEVTEKSKSSPAPPPLITTSLQRASSSQLGINPSQTMSIAQQLYEVLSGSVFNPGLSQLNRDFNPQEGFITYMRTDSPVLSSQAQVPGGSLNRVLLYYTPPDTTETTRNLYPRTLRRKWCR